MQSRGVHASTHTTHTHTCQVRADVIGNYQQRGQQQPEEALKHVGHDEGGGHDDDHDDAVRPCKLAELVLVHAPLQA
eukprot:1149430-Pelagomonas_calceolata.AAC.2